MLLARELLLGPRRYSDLREALPGLASNLLARRLRRLEADGLVVRTRLAPPAAVPVYELTEAGRRLEEPVLALARFGARYLGPLGAGEKTRAGWIVLGLAASIADVRRLPGSVEFRIDGEVLHLRPEGGRARAGYGPAPGGADLVVTATLQGLFDVLAGTIAARDAVSRGLVEARGRAALEALVDAAGFAGALARSE